MRVLTLAVFLLFLSGCNSLKTSFEFDENVDFGSYQTFAPLTVNDQVRGAIRRPAAVGRSIERAMIAGMQERGFVQNDESPDLHIVYFVSVDEMTADYEPLPYTARGSSSGLPVQTDRTGVLTLDLIDVSTNEMIWRGTASDAVDREDPNAEENIRTIVAKLLDGIPLKN